MASEQNAKTERDPSLARWDADRGPHYAQPEQQHGKPDDAAQRSDGERVRSRAKSHLAKYIGAGKR